MVTSLNQHCVAAPMQCQPLFGVGVEERTQLGQGWGLRLFSPRARRGPHARPARQHTRHATQYTRSRRTCYPPPPPSLSFSLSLALPLSHINRISLSLSLSLLASLPFPLAPSLSLPLSLSHSPPHSHARMHPLTLDLVNVWKRGITSRSKSSGAALPLM